MTAALRTVPRRAKGFALMMAIFMIVTLAAIGVYLITVSTGQTAAATQDEQGARAYQAARAGVEWGAYQLLRNSTGAFATGCAAGGATTTQLLTLIQGLDGFFAKVDCNRVGNETEAAVNVVVYRLTVTGCNNNPCGAGIVPTYVERQLELTVTK
jgi:MSHA biogenesis protein MshP